MEFIETLGFTNKVQDYLNDEELYDFQVHLILNPHAGDVIPGSNGLRKVRWNGKGKGKRGGLRVIYFNRLTNAEIWLLDIYAKNKKDNISLEKLKILRKEIPYE